MENKECVNPFETNQECVQSFRDMFSEIPHDRSKFEMEHIAINHNHAQVIWKGETPAHGIIRGTDSFAFDKNNRIKSQAIVALS